MIRSLPCHTVRSEKVISGNNFHCGRGPKFKFFMGEVKVSLGLAGSQSLSAQSKSQARVAHFGERPVLNPYRFQ